MEVSYRDTILLSLNNVKGMGVIFDANPFWGNHVGEVGAVSET